MLAHQVSRIIDGDTADSCDPDMETVASNNHVASQMYISSYIDLDKVSFFHAPIDLLGFFCML